jgi:hypothetical protein
VSLTLTQFLTLTLTLRPKIPKVGRQKMPRCQLVLLKSPVLRPLGIQESFVRTYNAVRVHAIRCTHYHDVSLYLCAYCAGPKKPAARWHTAGSPRLSGAAVAFSCVPPRAPRARVVHVISIWRRRRVVRHSPPLERRPPAIEKKKTHKLTLTWCPMALNLY